MNLDDLKKDISKLCETVGHDLVALESELHCLLERSLGECKAADAGEGVQAAQEPDTTTTAPAEAPAVAPETPAEAPAAETPATTAETPAVPTAG